MLEITTIAEFGDDENIVVRSERINKAYNIVIFASFQHFYLGFY